MFFPKRNTPTKTSKKLDSQKKKDLKQQEKKYRDELKRLKQKTEQRSLQKKKLGDSRAPKNAVDYIGYQRMLENGICMISPGVYSKTVKFSDINYQTARVADQKDMFSRYTEALNFADPTMPLQLTLITRQVDEDSFREEMFMPLVGNNDPLDKYRTEMNEMLANKIKEGQNSVIREKYFTFTCESENLDEATSTLSRFETQFISLFKTIGIDDMSALSGEERINLLREITRPDSRDYISLRDIARSGWTSKSFVAPTSFDFKHNRKSFTFGDKYGQVLYFGHLPTELTDELLTALSDLPINMVITLHIRNISQDRALSMVDTKIAMMEMENTKRARKGIQDGIPPEMMYLPETKRALAEAKELSIDLRQRQQRFFEVTPLIFTYADSPEQLAKNVFSIKQIAQIKTVSVEDIDLQQREGFNSILPIGKNHFGRERCRHLTTAATAILIPFTTQELFQKNGVYYGLNGISHNLIMFNRLSLQSPNGFILGKPGSGKSFAAKREIISVLLNDPNADVLIIDPEREYTALASGFAGEVIRISPDSSSHLNPMDINDNYADDDNPVSLKADLSLRSATFFPADCNPDKTRLLTVLSVWHTKNFTPKREPRCRLPSMISTIFLSSNQSRKLRALRCPLNCISKVILVFLRIKQMSIPKTALSSMISGILASSFVHWVCWLYSTKFGTASPKIVPSVRIHIFTLMRSSCYLPMRTAAITSLNCGAAAVNGVLSRPVSHKT